MIKRLLLCLAFLFTCGPAAAEVELHVVGIYEGFEQIGRSAHGPRAKVFLDRPGAEVVLVLSSYAAVKWEVEVSRDTAPPSVVLVQTSGGKRTSEVWVNGARMPEPIRMKLEMTYRPEGDRFRKLVRQVPEKFGVPRMSSFSGSYTAPEVGFDVSEVRDDPRYADDYLKSELNPAALPASLRPFVRPDVVGDTQEVILTGDGFMTFAADGQQDLHLLPLDMPSISWPRGAVRDARTDTLYGVTLGGQGYLYAYSVTTDNWRVVRSMDGLDVQGLLLDDAGRRLIMPLGLNREGEIALIGIDGDGSGPVQAIKPNRPYPGYTDLFDPGNGPSVDLIPVAVDGDLLLLIARADMSFGIRSAPPGEDVIWRGYVVDLSTGQVDLVGYEGGIAGE